MGEAEWAGGDGGDGRGVSMLLLYGWGCRVALVVDGASLLLLISAGSHGLGWSVGGLVLLSWPWLLVMTGRSGMVRAS